ncbi:MAG: hypothetical protein QM485_15615 [Flavobacteriaceae bacterium]
MSYLDAQIRGIKATDHTQESPLGLSKAAAQSQKAGTNGLYGPILSTAAPIIEGSLEPYYFCPNRNGNVFNDRWEGYIGRWDSPTLTNSPLIVDGSHTIITTSSLDPNTGDKVPTIFPGSNYSIRIGSEINGAQAESLR